MINRMILVISFLVSPCILAETHSMTMEEVRRILSISKTKEDLSINILMKSRKGLLELDRFVLKNQFGHKKQRAKTKIRGTLINLELKNGAFLKIQYLGKGKMRINGRIYNKEKRESIWRFLKRIQKRVYVYNRDSIDWFSRIMGIITPYCYAEGEVEPGGRDFGSGCEENPRAQDLQDMHQLISTLFISEACGRLCADSFSVDCDQNKITVNENRSQYDIRFPRSCPGVATLQRVDQFRLNLGTMTREVRLDLDSECREITFGNRVGWLSDDETARELARDIRTMALGFQQRECNTTSGEGSLRPENGNET